MTDPRESLGDLTPDPATDPKISFNPSTDIPPQTSKVILITGANTGLGKASALELAQHGPAEVWLTARDPVKGKAAVAEVAAKASPGTKVSFLELDLSSMASVKAAAKTFLASASRLDILMLNAGIMANPHTATVDDYEIQMATNHLGHALLFKLLEPLLAKTVASGVKDVRVVVLASEGHKRGTGTITFDHLKGKANILAEEPTAMERYCQSKLANVFFAQQLAARYPAYKTLSICPGIVRTELFERETKDELALWIKNDYVAKMGRSVEEGVKNQLWAATANDPSQVSGKFYEPIGWGGLEAPWALNKELSLKLWDWTEKELAAFV